MRKWLIVILLSFLVFNSLSIHAQEPTEYRVITTENAYQLREVGRIGRGVVNDIALNPAGDTLAVGTSIGIWFYTFPSLEDIDYFASLSVLKVAWSPDGKKLL